MKTLSTGKFLKRVRDGESGGILVPVIIIVALSCLTIASLDFMTNGLISTGARTFIAQEFHAAEAGVQDAMWKIQHVATGLPRQSEHLPGDGAANVISGITTWGLR